MQRSRQHVTLLYALGLQESEQHISHVPEPSGQQMDL